MGFTLGWYAIAPIAIGIILFFIGMTSMKKKRDMLSGISVMMVVGGIAFAFLVPQTAVIPLSTDPSQTASVNNYGAQNTYVVQGNSVCGDDNKGSLYSRQEDTSASSLTYVASTPYLISADGILSPLVYGAPALGTSGWTLLNASVVCGETYQIGTVTTAGTYQGVVSSPFSMNKEQVQVELDGKQLSFASVYIEDDTGSKRYLSDHGSRATNTTGYVDVNSTLVDGTSSAADIAVGTDGYISDVIKIKSATANKFVVAPGDRLIICVDTGTDGEWQEPVIGWNGRKLSSSGVKASLGVDDVSAPLVNAAEYCYDAGSDGIADTPSTMDFYIKAKSGMDPDTSADDIAVSFLGEGYFKSSKADVLKKGIYTDASTQALVVSSTAYVPTITYQLS